MVRASVVHPHAGQITVTERLDRWATHPLWGFCLLLGVLGLLFWLTFAAGVPVQHFLDVHVVRAAADRAERLLSGTFPWLSGLVAEGIIGGVGTVLTFLPILVIFFIVLGVLEEVGYMARVAYVMDRFMHRMGLHGKSFLPLFLGFGCNVPAVMGTRIIDAPRARLLTILLAPLVPCTARMTVIAFLAPAFFGPRAVLVSWGLVIGNLVVLALSGMVISRLVLKTTRAAFIMELPLYHLPSVRTVGLSVWHRMIAFLKRAGSIILIVSVVIWLFATLPGGEIQTSYLAGVGRLLAPVGEWMGLDWRMMVALIASFIAKENAIATLGVLFGTGEEDRGLIELLTASLTPAAALAFLVVEMLFIPCMATVAAIYQETRSWRWTGFNVLFLLAVSFAAGILVYQVARLLG